MTVDLVLRGVTALTGDRARPVLGDAELGVRGNRIAYLRARSDEPPEGARVLDLPGRLLLPGLVNVHTHATLTYARGVAEDLGTAPAYTVGVPGPYSLSRDEARAFARLGVLELALFGSTPIGDLYVHADLVADACAEIGVRAVVAEFVHDVDLAGLPHGRWAYDDATGRRTLAAGLALADRSHGTAGDRIRVALAPHAPDTCSDGLLRRVAAAAAERDLPVTTHLAQSSAEVQRVRARSGVGPVELLARCGLLTDRLVAAHCVHLEAGDAERLAAAGAAVAHVPKGNATGGMAAPTDRLRRAGVSLALATDNMHADLVEAMRWALAVGRLQEGRVSDRWQPADVLAMATTTGAAALGLGEEIGLLAEGRKADLVVVDARRPHLTPLTDPLGTLIHAGQGRDVELVVVDGRVIVEDGRSTQVDEAAVRRQATEAAARVWRSP